MYFSMFKTLVFSISFKIIFWDIKFISSQKPMKNQVKLLNDGWDSWQAEKGLFNLKCYNNLKHS